MNFIFVTVILTNKMTKNDDRSPAEAFAQNIDTHSKVCPLQERTVILWGQENILGSVVENLLDSLRNWKVIRISENNEESILIDDIKTLSPEIVIVYKSEQLIESQQLLQLLDDCPGLKIITVSPESNSVQIYNKQRVWIKNSDEFLSIVES